jgi:flagellar basal-body rod protein FlgF
MSHAIYTALSGAVAQERNLETIADNLANTNTVGFKGSRLSFRDLVTAQEGVDGSQSPHIQVDISHSQNDFTQGHIVKSNNPTDVALKGPGFFSVLTEDGERLTRQGTFIQASDGVLRTHSGHAVLGESGPIQGPANRPLKINADGSVFCDDVYVDSLKRSHAQDPNSVVREGNAMWRADDLSALTRVSTPVEVGATERSNVNPVVAMTQLINVQRSYEMYHRAIENVRAIEQKTSQELG